MRLLTITLLVVAITGCGKHSDTYITQTETVTETIVQKQDFEGVYRFANNSQIELLTAYDGEVYLIRGGQVLNSENPQNGTLGSFPALSLDALEEVNGKLFTSLNVNYTSGHDLEHDVTGSNVTGTKKTDLTIELDDLGKLKLTIEVYENNIGNNINGVIMTRVFTEF